MSKRLVALVVGGTVAAMAAGSAIVYETTSYRPRGERQSGELALVGATVLAGESLVPVLGGVVLIRDGVITQVGTAAEVAPPAGASVIDVSGYTLAPGLIDLHVHLGSPALDVGRAPGPLTNVLAVWDTIRFSPRHRRSALEHGVTTVRSLGDEGGWVTEMRNQVANGDLEGPRVVTSGPLFTTRGGHPIATLGVDPGSDMVRLPSNPDEARSMVRALAVGEKRADVIKVVHDRGSTDRPLSPLPLDVLAATVSEAHTLNLRVTAHWSTLQDLDDLLSVGVDGLEHIESQDLLTGWPDDVLARLINADVPLTASLVVSEAALSERQVPGAMVALKDRVRELHLAGGRVAVGSDAGRPGVRFGAGLHRELALLVASGLHPREVLHAATVENARVLGVDDVGLIASGMAADLVLVDGDPTLDIDAMSNVILVLRDGRVVVDNRYED